jgi:hypothetical protein
MTKLSANDEAERPRATGEEGGFLGEGLRLLGDKNTARFLPSGNRMPSCYGFWKSPHVSGEFIERRTRLYAEIATTMQNTFLKRVNLVTEVSADVWSVWKNLTPRSMFPAGSGALARKNALRILPTA